MIFPQNAFFSLGQQKQQYPKYFSAFLAMFNAVTIV